MRNSKFRPTQPKSKCLDPSPKAKFLVVETRGGVEKTWYFEPGTENLKPKTSKDQSKTKELLKRQRRGRRAY